MQIRLQIEEIAAVFTLSPPTQRLLVLRAGDASARHRRARRKPDRLHQAEFGCSSS